MENPRRSLAKAKRIVVKVGTHTLVNNQGRPHLRRIAQLCHDIAELMKQNKQVILVSSGAIAAGIETLGLKQRPNTISGLQMAAATGQIRLLSLYHRYFKRHQQIASQVLLTYEDLKHRTRHLNARNTLHALLKNKVIPIINENDAVSTAEIKFGDNDMLSAMVAGLVDADLLIMLSTPDGLRDFKTTNYSKRISYLPAITPAVFKHAKTVSNTLSTGGMQAKLAATKTANQLGCPVVIAQGSQKHMLQRVLAGEDTGTLVGTPALLKPQKHRKRWLGYFHKTLGTITVDQGAANAISTQGKSLLAIGITSVTGQFSTGSPVSVCDPAGNTIAQGLVNFSSDEIDLAKGKPSLQVQTIFGVKRDATVIHRDNMVVFQ